MNERSYAALLCVVTLASTVFWGHSLCAAVPHFGETRVLHGNATSDVGADYLPRIAADGHGHWVVVWTSQEDFDGFVGTDSDIFVSISSDGRAWSAPAPLNSSASFDTDTDSGVDLATDGAGNWVAVWGTTETFGVYGIDRDLFVSHSTDNGATWTAMAALNSNAAVDSASDKAISLASDGNGVWIAVWQSGEDLGGAIDDDEDILFSRSTDNGSSWSPVAALNTNAVDDLHDRAPCIASIGIGTWVVVWETLTDIGGTIGNDFDIVSATSSDGGLSWSAPVVVNGYAGTDGAADMAARVRCNELGTCLATWSSAHDLSGGTADNEVFVVRSTDSGASWSYPEYLNTNAVTDVGHDFNARFAAGQAGQWMAAWESADNSSGTIGWDYDVFFTFSEDDGMTWSSPRLIGNNGETDSENDNAVSLATDGRGDWVAVWESESDLDVPLGVDDDIFTSGAFSIFLDDFESGNLDAWSNSQ